MRDTTLSNLLGEKLEYLFISLIAAWELIASSGMRGAIIFMIASIVITGVANLFFSIGLIAGVTITYFTLVLLIYAGLLWFPIL